MTELPHFYIAHALVFDEQNKLEHEIFCGLYTHRRNAYQSIDRMMQTAGTMNYIPQVRVAEVLDLDHIEIDDDIPPFAKKAEV